MGSLYTSIIPSLIVPGMGKAVKSARRKILLLNACNDRETTWRENGEIKAYTMVDFVEAIAKALFGDNASIKMHQVTNEDGFMNLEEVAKTIINLGGCI